MGAYPGNRQVEVGGKLEQLKWVADVCTYLTVIAGFAVAIWKIARPLRAIEERIKRLEGYTHNDYMNTLRLTVMSEEMPLEERLAAGEKYVREGGNGAIKAKYHMLIEQYQTQHKEGN